MKKKVAFYTAGCRLNQSETAVLTDRFTRMGYQKVTYGEPTDLLVLNTCTVTENAEADCRRVIRRTLRHSPKAFVAVTGCYAQTGLNTLQHLPGVDLVLGNQYKMLLPDYLEEMPHVQKLSSTFVRHSGSMGREDFVQDGVGEYATTRANLKIQDGCNFMCSFCLIPFARGRERSRLSDDAVREAEQLVERGHRELVLTGVNIGRFANGSGGLLDLIQRLERIPGLARIRISSIEPTTIPPALIEYMSTSRKLCRFLHVPLQSGHDEILSAMNRRYSVKEYRALGGTRRAKDPGRLRGNRRARRISRGNGSPVFRDLRTGPGSAFGLCPRLQLFRSTGDAGRPFGQSRTSGGDQNPEPAALTAVLDQAGTVLSTVSRPG